ncbi:hypothetical protein BDW02DRAFT_594209 [Decorospora gaudefroyi]|uniref:Uncharacterized protein n=1 Tax=Decorospora gaudefroyi TaxID=184978 RepID=A0A6A5KUB5_9PLEO|nr:hypothetical protein BDW02DRAFT_594209 [Decorospora gaudefroyi]
MSQTLPPTSPLLTLPGEIRNHIVEYVLNRELGTAPPPVRRSPLAFASTCRQLYDEYYALARSATIFTISWVSQEHLRMKASILPPAFASSIKKLQLQLPSRLTDLDASALRRWPLKSFGFAWVGLTELEEVYIRYRPEHHEKGVGWRGRQVAVRLLRKLLGEGKLHRLRKVCIVHDGTQPYLSLTLLHGMMKTQLRHSGRCKVQSDLEHGQLLLVRDEVVRDGVVRLSARHIAINVGYSFREAEEYVAVCEQVLEQKLAKVIVTRRADCKYVTPLHAMSDDALRHEVDTLNTLFPVSGDEEPLLHPHVQAIRNLQNCDSYTKTLPDRTSTCVA